MLPDPHPGPLPPYASFASRRPSDSLDHPYQAMELASLGPRAVEVRRLTFRLGRAAAHAALAGLGRDTGPILLGPDRAPGWPNGVVGSISHTSALGVALAAVAAHCDGAGIDVEARRHAPELDDLVPRPEERAWLAGAVPAARADLLLALFSAKESVFKAFYPRVGVLFGFEAASLRPTPRGFAARLVAPLDPAYPPAREFPVSVLWRGDLVMTWLLLPCTSR